jgi:hypothetical protein
MRIVNGVEIRTDSDYAKLPLPRQTIELIKSVHAEEAGTVKRWYTAQNDSHLRVVDRVGTGLGIPECQLVPSDAL